MVYNFIQIEYLREIARTEINNYANRTMDELDEYITNSVEGVANSIQEPNSITESDSVNKESETGTTEQQQDHYRNNSNITKTATATEATATTIV